MEARRLALRIVEFSMYDVTAKSRTRSGICLCEACSREFRSKHGREHSTEIPHQNTYGMERHRILQRKIQSGRS